MQTQLRGYRHLVLQSGEDEEMDRYIYGQEGEEIGSFFGALLRRVIPFASKAIKGAVQVAKPHLKEIGTELIKAGGKEVIEKISGGIAKAGSKINRKSSNIIELSKS